MSHLIDGVVLDTSTAIAHLRRQRKLSDLVPDGTPMFLPMIALGELYHGAERSPHKKRSRHELEIFLAGMILIVADTAVAERYGVIAADLARAGKPIPTNDVWIAAAAVTVGLPLAARDAHFDHIAGLRLIRC